jgi:phosphate transport system substrate-binding protein
MRRFLLAVPLLLVGGLLALVAPSQAASYPQLEGSGPRGVSHAVDQWNAHLASLGFQVLYLGDDQGHADFAEGFVDFAIDDVPYLGTDPDGISDTSAGRELTYAPLVGDTVAFGYRLDSAGTPVAGVRLSPRTLLGIFAGTITRWDDPAITRDNHGRSLPPKTITPVVPTGSSDVTYQLSSWFAEQLPQAWAAYAGKAGPVLTYPVPTGGTAAAASDLVDTMAAKDGAITFLPGSEAARRDLPVVSVLNAAGFFVTPGGAAASLALRAATIGSDHAPLLAGVYRSQDPRAYPASYVDSMFVPLDPADPRESTAKRQEIADFAQHALCDQAGYDALQGYAPLPLALTRPALQQVRRLGAIDPAVDVSGDDLADCASPLLGGSPVRDLLPARVPLPRSCDAVDAGPCPTAPPAAVRHCFVKSGARTCATLSFALDQTPVRGEATVKDLRGDARQVQVSSLRLLVDRDAQDGSPFYPARTAGDQDGWHAAGDTATVSRRSTLDCDRYVLRARVGVRNGGVTRWYTRTLVAGYDRAGCS